MAINKPYYNKGKKLKTFTIKKPLCFWKKCEEKLKTSTMNKPSVKSKTSTKNKPQYFKASRLNIGELLIGDYVRSNCNRVVYSLLETVNKTVFNNHKFWKHQNEWIGKIYNWKCHILLWKFQTIFLKTAMKKENLNEKWCLQVFEWLRVASNCCKVDVHVLVKRYFNLDKNLCAICFSYQKGGKQTRRLKI